MIKAIKGIIVMGVVAAIVTGGMIYWAVTFLPKGIIRWASNHEMSFKEAMKDEM